MWTFCCSYILQINIVNGGKLSFAQFKTFYANETTMYGCLMGRSSVWNTYPMSTKRMHSVFLRTARCVTFRILFASASAVGPGLYVREHSWSSLFRSVLKFFLCTIRFKIKICERMLFFSHVFSFIQIFKIDNKQSSTKKFNTYAW